MEVHDDRHDTAEGLQADADAQRRTVVREVLLAVGVGGPDTGGVTDGVDEGVGGSAFSWRTGDGVSDPGVDGAVLGEDDVHEEEGEVLWSETVGCHEDDETDDSDGDGVEEKPEAVAEAIGEVGVRHAVEDDEDVGGRDEQEGDKVVVLEC